MSSEIVTRPDVSRRLALVLLVAILAVGGLTRFWRIGQKELWLDECISALAVEGSLAQTAANVAEHDAHPPLYYLLLNATTRLTGRSEAGLRVLSALASIGCVVLTYAIGAALLSRAAGLLASGGLALSSFQLYFAQEARLHALVSLLVLGATYVFVRVLRSRETALRALWPWMAAYGLLVAALLYTYYYAAFAIAAHVVAYCALWLGAKLRRDASGERWLLTPRRADALWPAFLAATLLGGLLFTLGWGGVMFERLRSGSGVPSSAYGVSDVVAASRQFLTGPVVDRLAPRLDWFMLSLMTLVAALPFAAAACAAGRAPGAALLLGLLVLVPFGCLAFIPRPHVFEAKHLVFVAPALYLMLACGWSWRRSRVLSVVVILLLALMNTTANWVYFRTDYRKECWRHVARELQVRGRRGDVVVVTPRYAAHPLGRYYDGPLRVIPADSARQVRSAAASARSAMWLVELRSRVASPSPHVSLWLSTQRAWWAPMPAGRTFSGFTSFPTSITVRRFVRRPAAGR